MPLDSGVMLRITVSSGLTEHVLGESPADTLSRADKWLYEAKTQGRNQVVSHSHKPTTAPGLGS